MAYLVELDVDAYGMLDGGYEIFPISVTDHDWRNAYPAVAEEVEFAWERGGLKKKPNVFYYPHMDNFVCDPPAYGILMQICPDDVHVIATGTLDGETLFLMQVPNVMDGIVEKSSSVYQKFPSYEILSFPAFHASARRSTLKRMFRVPESLSLIFVGEDVKRSLDEAGIRGFRYLPVDWVS